MVKNLHISPPDPRELVRESDHHYSNSIGSPGKSPTFKVKSPEKVLGSIDKAYDTGLMNIQTATVVDRGQPSMNQLHMQYLEEQKRAAIQ